MLQRLLTPLIVCIWFHLASGQTLPKPRAVSDIANPLNDPAKCRHNGRSHVCNPDGILSIEQGCFCRIYIIQHFPVNNSLIAVRSKMLCFQKGDINIVQ